MKVALGLSGGVDSSVAAYLLKKQGYDVIGVNFSLTGQFQDQDCFEVAKKLDISLVRLDFKQIFSRSVFEPFIADYSRGVTPNLCVRCNQFIKFGALYDWAKSNGCDFVATGHYVRLVSVGDKRLIARPSDNEKDQTYFLNHIDPTVLNHVLFPLADLTKAQVRAIAAEQGLVTANKKGSSDICLMGDMSFREFISPHIKARGGLIKSGSGEIVGEHQGLFNYTLGQRKGLGLGGKSGESGRWFVVDKNVDENVLVVSHGDERALFKKTLTATDLNFFVDVADEFSCEVKIRYRDTLKKATVKISEGLAKVTFDEEQRAITPGQFCVFYKDGILVGGGVII